MKKLICLLCSLILVLACSAAVFAENGLYLYDPISGELLDGESGNSSNLVKLPSGVRYSRTKKTYTYSTDTAEDSDITLNVYDGMIVTSSVELTVGSGSDIIVYRDGEIVDPSEYEKMTASGSYIIRHVDSEAEILSFTKVESITNALYSYRLPSIFYVTSAYRDDEEVLVNANTVDMTLDGMYVITYQCIQTGAVYTLKVTVDHTYPELVMNGVNEDGYANSAVTFGDQEYGSHISIKKDGVDFNMVGAIKSAGDYVVKYTDQAGNTSTYYFTMNIFLDIGAWVFVVLAVGIVGLAIGFMIFSRKSMRVR